MPHERSDAYRNAEKRIEKARRERAKELDLSNMGLTEVPEALWKLTALERLYLANNQLATLPEALGQLTALQWLDLSDNQFTTLPETLGKLAALQRLGLYNNRLTTLPEAIGGLAQLEDLILEENALRELPASMKGLSRLKMLTLHGNDALGLPAEVLGPCFHDSRASNPPAKPAAILHYYFSKRSSRSGAVSPTPVVTRIETPATATATTPPVASTAPQAQPATADTHLYDVFISTKSEDFVHARDAAAFLRKAGLRVFLSVEQLPEMGNSDYFDAIFTALEGCRHMLVVASRRAHVESRWVKKEWQTFLNEKMSERKHGNLVSLLCGEMKIGDLPLSLRQHEARHGDDLASLLHYFKPRQ